MPEGKVDLDPYVTAELDPPQMNRLRSHRWQVRRGRDRVAIAPALAEHLPVQSDHAERIPEGDVEACRPDQHIQRALAPIIQLDACWMNRTILATSSIIRLVVVRDTDGGQVDNEPTHACVDRVDLEEEVR